MSVLKEFNPATNQWETILIGKPGEPANLANTAPADLGVPAVGTEITAARGNHVHKMPSASDVGAAANNDSRLTDARTPTDGSVTDTKIVSGGLSPTVITGTAVVTGDARLSDERTPTDGTVTDAKIVSGGLATSAITGTAVITTDARLTNERVPLDGSVTSNKIAIGGLPTSSITGTAVVTGDARLSDERVPTDGSVSEAKIANLAVTAGKIANGTITNTQISDTAAINPRKVNAPRIHYQTSQPSTGLAAGDIWVDSDGTA
jgi:hypothetical protein